MRRSTLAVVLLSPLLALAPRGAAAQPVAKPAAPAAAPAAKPAAKPAEPPVATPAPSAKPDELTSIPKVEVDDPALAPALPAPHLLNGWKEALGMISARSIDLLIAQQAVLRAEGSYQQVLARALPTITGSANITENLPGAVNLFAGGTTTYAPIGQTSISAQQPIFALQAWFNIKTAEISTRSAKLSVDDRRRLVLAQVADAIIGVFTAERIAEINRISLRNALQRQNLAERRARLGDGTRLDILRAQQDASVTRGTLIAGDESLRKARETLGLSLGATEGYGVPPNISLDEMATAINSTCTPGSLEQRADILAAQATFEAAERAVKSARLAYMPTAQVSSAFTVSSQQLQGREHYAWSIQGTLSIPIWDGNLTAGAIKVARTNAEEARLRLDLTRRTASIQTLQALRAVSVAEQARQVSEQNRNLAREAARLAERSFMAGAGTSFDLIDASRQERSAELDLAVKEFTLIQTKVAALLATANCAY